MNLKLIIFKITSNKTSSYFRKCNDIELIFKKVPHIRISSTDITDQEIQMWNKNVSFDAIYVYGTQNIFVKSRFCSTQELYNAEQMRTRQLCRRVEWSSQGSRLNHQQKTGSYQILYVGLGIPSVSAHLQSIWQHGLGRDREQRCVSPLRTLCADLESTLAVVVEYLHCSPGIILI